MTSHPAPKPLILVVDDNRDAVTLLERLLQLKGYSTQTCYNGQTALEAIERLHPAGVLMDLAMPDMDGFTVCRLVRAQPWGAKLLLVALSGYSSSLDQQRSRAAGFDVHLTKPVDFTKLLGLLADRLA